MRKNYQRQQGSFHSGQEDDSKLEGAGDTDAIRNGQSALVCISQSTESPKGQSHCYG